MRLVCTLVFLIGSVGINPAFAASETPIQPAVAETTVEDTTPATTYGSGCPFGGYEEASTEEVVS